MADEGRKGGNELAILGHASMAWRDRPLEAHYQGLWFTLSRFRWNSLVLVPADLDVSTAGIATVLSDVGRRLRDTPVTFLVMAGSIDYASAGKFVSAVTKRGGQADASPASSRVVVAVPPVILEPLALAVTDAADAVALYVKKGNTNIDAAARTIELVGRDRIVGCLLA